MAGKTGKRSSRAAEPTTLSLFPDEPALDPAAALAAAPPGVPDSWARALGSEFIAPYFADLQKFVAGERQEYDIYPPEEDVYNAFRYTPLDDVRVVILGQDPYPNPGQGHGLCFSVKPGVVLPGSLRNIYRELQSDLSIPPAKHGYLVSWAKQGVLLLNTVLTVRAGKPASHANKGWETFTHAALRAVDMLPRKVVFVLWGSHAQKKTAIIDTSRHTIITSAHPSPLSASNGFFGSKPFSKVNAALEGAGEPTIDWKLPEKVVEE
ncbi:uracil-DNA glycosylase [Fimbriiglobus ruber]|uniref:Uracil-DNA glycosylase n=1 Tax=Fimbriiglobus ruber TaxID=1908690 RepID=A0A225DG71_9BACT|nr:uracil-DNA glycosylase [Fimbriiglobus ruber]OWK36356.1 Uracil-DNA glycosylase, family 1 [Fimbriiglobus ruber]